ncbi:ABC transporter permease [Nocardioides carbamazepini]|uniref:ABC transporter permease n=1 Tax=Nocardioides carbamazepini TaxID=2854259 RepID=UPI00214A625D|nr:ABC transporter permease [Nocardioides carbamazepini]MCR1784969.1 ABC transporter permease [Nocardioides carbamazepini]
MSRLGRVLLGSLIPIVVLVIYAFATRSGLDPYYPSMASISSRFSELWLFERVGSDVWPSMRNLAFGYLVAIAVGVPVGLLLGMVVWLHDLLAPLIDFARSVPAIIFIPPLILVLGIGDVSKVLIIALGAGFPLLITTIDGVRKTDRALLDVARAIRLSRRRTIWNIVLPGAAPSIMGGAQTGLQVGFFLLIASEMVGASSGIGYLMMRAQASFDSPTLWAGIVLLSLMGFVLNLLFLAVRNRIIHWHLAMRAVSGSR